MRRSNKLIEMESQLSKINEEISKVEVIKNSLVEKRKNIIFSIDQFEELVYDEKIEMEIQ